MNLDKFFDSDIDQETSVLSLQDARQLAEQHVSRLSFEEILEEAEHYSWLEGAVTTDNDLNLILSGKMSLDEVKEELIEVYTDKYYFESE